MTYSTESDWVNGNSFSGTSGNFDTQGDSLLLGTDSDSDTWSSDDLSAESGTEIEVILEIEQLTSSDEVSVQVRSGEFCTEGETVWYSSEDIENGTITHTDTPENTDCLAVQLGSNSADNTSDVLIESLTINDVDVDE